ncbi:MAG: hypothetical protein P8X50_06305 [Maritimibacter sp.]
MQRDAPDAWHSAQETGRFEVDPNAEFLSYGYEQQAAMVQDFTCYALFDRQSPRLDELATLLRPVLPVDDFLAKLTP